MTENTIMLGYILLMITVIVGWVLNIFAIVATVGDPINGLFILRVAGIFLAPLGAVLGFV